MKTKKNFGKQKQKKTHKYTLKIIFFIEMKMEKNFGKQKQKTEI